MISRSHPFRVRIRATLVASVVLVSALVGCSPSGGDDEQKAKKPKGDELIINLNGPLSDPYFSTMKQGSDAAAKAFGVKYQYSSTKDVSNFVPEYSPLIQAAIARNPDAIVIGNFVPSAFDPLIKRAVKKGIPVVVVDTGADTYQENGAIGFVGTDRPADGVANGKAALKEGVKHLLCVNHAPVNPTLHQICAGAKKTMTAAGGTSKELAIPIADSGNPTKVKQAIQGYLRSHPETDGVLTLGSEIATNAISAVDDAGKTGKVKIGSFTNSTAQMEAVKAGKMHWIDDAQQYLEGYYSMQIAIQYARYGMLPTRPVYTGGLIITKENVDKALETQRKYPGMRGPN